MYLPYHQKNEKRICYLILFSTYLYVDTTSILTKNWINYHVIAFTKLLFTYRFWEKYKTSPAQIICWQLMKFVFGKQCLIWSNTEYIAKWELMRHMLGLFFMTFDNFWCTDIILIWLDYNHHSLTVAQSLSHCCSVTALQTVYTMTKY